MTKKLEALFEYCEGLNKSLLAKDTILKLQQDKIKKLLEHTSLEDGDLQKEVDALHLCLENNPEVQRLKIENQEMMGMLLIGYRLTPFVEKLRALGDGSEASDFAQLSELFADLSHRYHRLMALRPVTTGM